MKISVADKVGSFAFSLGQICARIAGRVIYDCEPLQVNEELEEPVTPIRESAAAMSGLRDSSNPVSSDGAPHQASYTPIIAGAAKKDPQQAVTAPGLSLI